MTPPTQPTHPPSGPNSPPRPSGPARLVAPLTTEKRTDNYRRQNGTDRLTPRQQRRIEHKANRALATHPGPPGMPPQPQPRPGTPPPPSNQQ